MGGINFPGVRGNATVPSNAPIQPPQAFVDNAAYFAFPANDLFMTPATSFIKGDFLTNWIQQSFNANVANLHASGCSISNPANINIILAACVAAGSPNGILDLSGGTNAAPTGQGITDKATLILAGWTVTTN